MANDFPILLFVSDQPVLSSLQFSLAIEGFEVADGAVEGTDPSAASALVIDQTHLADALATLAALGPRGCRAPVFVLATNPTARMRARAAAAGAVLIEKPLMGDELTRALRAVLGTQEAA